MADSKVATKRKLASWVTGSLLWLAWIPSLAGATPPVNDQLFSSLLNDFPSEVQQYAKSESIHFQDGEFETFSLQWKNWLAGGMLGQAPCLVRVLPSCDIVEGIRESTGSTTTLNQLKAIRDVRGRVNSTVEPLQYISDRIGSSASNLIRTGRLDAEVVGAMQGTLTFLKNGQTAYKLPSPFEKWGIQKYFVRSGERAKIVFLVPPSREYLLHYSAMFDFLGAAHQSVFMDSSAKVQLEKSMNDELLKLIGDLHVTSSRPVWFSLGYQSMIQDMTTSGKIENQGEAIGKHFTLKAFALKSHPDSVIISIASDLTLWGEGSEMVVKSLLNHSPAGILFMGSAGHLGRNFKIYDSSIPSIFLDETKHKIAIRNILFHGDVAQGPIHMSTYSPMSETVDRVDDWRHAGVSTVDVEQSRIAEAIAEYNQLHGKTVRFGAIDLITDYPLSTEFPVGGSNDLSHVDAAAKAAKKALLVDRAIQGLETTLGCPDMLRAPRTN